MNAAALPAGAGATLDVHGACLRLHGEWVVAEAEGLRAAVVALWPGLPPGRLVVDASAVSEIDGAGIQLLVALGQALLATGHDPVLRVAPERLRRAAAALGAGDALRCCGMVVDASEAP